MYWFNTEKYKSLIIILIRLEKLSDGKRKMKSIVTCLLIINAWGYYISSQSYSIIVEKSQNFLENYVLLQ